MIIVTGATRGLGMAICERLAANGKDVIGVARNPADGDSRCVPCSVTNYGGLRELYDRWRKEGKSVEAIINAAGIASMNLAVTTPESVTRKVIETNLMGTIFCCQIFAPLMIRNKTGRIINFSTIAVPLGLKGESIYVASKAGMEGFSRSFAREMADFGITVNCIAPGPIDTDLLKGIGAEKIQRIIDRQIVHRQFQPKDVCDLVELLLDPKAANVTGEVLHVGGV